MPCSVSIVELTQGFDGLQVLDDAVSGRQALGRDAEADGDDG